jgi:predicted patatin/cPLA2 family phospholipase
MRRRVFLLLTLGFVLQGCASVPPRNALPEALADEATVPGSPFARFWGDESPPDIEARVARLKLQMEQNPSSLKNPRFYLTISGGGANGAFAAGLLKGWSESGTRPEMWIVTGISTGALIAPFAFLGSDYDDDLERLYTTLSTKDLVKKRSLLSAVTSDAVTDTEPLRKLLKELVSREMIAEIARETGRGRRLVIGTTNIDARRPVLWNIGAIAKVATDEADQLIRDILLASASIPGAFPPVRIPVRVGDEIYDELHVDGGVTSQVFLYPAQLDLREASDMAGASREQSVFVIRNSQLDARWSEVKPKLAPVALASIDALIRTQGLGDLYRIYLGAKRDDMPFYLAYIPSSFDLRPNEQFDPEYMRALFDLAYEEARDGYDWERSPPGIILP